MTTFPTYAHGYRMGHSGDRGIVLVEIASIAAWRCGFADGAEDSRLSGRRPRPHVETEIAIMLELNRCRRDLA